MVARKHIFFLLSWLFLGSLVYAQTSATSAVTGTITDPSGALISNATVELHDNATNDVQTTKPSAAGVYTFSSVRPGNYSISVTARGFRTVVVPSVSLQVGKSALLNFNLEVGAAAETVEVQAGAAAELQTLDSSVGNVISRRELENMPSLNRDATALLLLQPMTTSGFNQAPDAGEQNVGGGTVAGARPDQNTFMIDGGDASSNTEGAGGYNTGFTATPRAVVPTPVESLEEFRVATNNQNATFNRSSGGEVQMVTRRGSNSFHGSLYEYVQNDNLNANSWTRNHLADPVTGLSPQKRPELRDNRFGGRLGGPIWKDKTFFFLMYEGRHFQRNNDFTRLVPTASMRLGLIKDSDGGVVNLNPYPVVDPDTGATIPGSAIDPRGIGISPVISAEWAQLPLPNNFGSGDGANSAGFNVPSPQTVNEEFGVARLDHDISQKWKATASFRYGVTDNVPSNVQVDIRGGTPKPTASRPLQPRYLVFGLTGQLTPNLVNDFHFDWLRHWWQWQTKSAEPLVPCSSTGQIDCSDAALQINRENRDSGMVPINVDTQNARQRTWNGRDLNFTDNVSWMKGSHMLQFGGRSQLQHFFHRRDDKVVGGITSPIYYVARGGDFQHTTGFPANPLTISDTLWNRYFVDVTGMVDAATQVLTRAPDLSPNPPLTPILQHTVVDAYELHFSDTWRIKPSLTLTYGLTWGVQLPPYEENGTQTMLVDAADGKPIVTAQYFKARAAAAQQGQVYNPTIGFVPIRSLHRKYPYDTDYTNLGPRLGLAWNPSFTDGPLGALLGNRRTVIRGGWARVFDRVNGVGIVMTPALGIGFGDQAICKIPNTLGACNQGGDPTTNFRIGVDGSHVNIPSLPAISGTMIIPGLVDGVAQVPGANSIFENRDFRIDPRRQVGGTDSIDFSIQRELPGRMLLEVGYVGKWSRDLYQNVELNHVPYMFQAGGQTLATAWDALAAQVRGGAGTFTPQPWFETMLGGSAYCAGFASCTEAVATNEDVFDGDLGDSFLDIEPSFTTGPLTAMNTQIAGIDMTVSNGIGNYHAGFASLRKSQGALGFSLNYTFSKSLDLIGLAQENTDALPDAYFPKRTYGPSQYDMRHIFNSVVSYELPFGQGKPFATRGALDKIVGGWSVASILTASSGLPMFVYNFGGDFSEFGSSGLNGDSAGWIRTSGGVITSSRHNTPTIGANGFGQSSADGGFPNAFGNPDAVAALFRPVTFADQRAGMGAIRGLPRWNLDFGVTKTTRITERVGVRFDAQFINLLNNVQFKGDTTDNYFNTNAALDTSTPEAFGVLNNQFNAPRFIQFGLKLEF
jgi:Carboxypeptidase regulatory-like domain